MDLVVTADYESMSRAAADAVVEVVAQKPNAALVLATGNTPVGLYRELAARQRAGRFDAAHLRIFQLDAYLGLAPDDDRSLYRWLDESFLRPLAIPASHVVRLPGDSADPAETCRLYDQAVAAAGGFDLAVLGLGPNGHLGFNEPPVDPSAPSRVVDLTEASVASNAPYWGGPDRVPRRALTAGMAQLLGAKRVILLVSGAHKRDILQRTVSGPVTGDVPASYLRTAAHVTVFADHAGWSAAATEP